MIKIGIVSDTHGLLRPEVLDRLAGVDHIVHAGDIGSSAIVPRLQAIAPTTAIRGNVDTAAWALAYPPTAVVEHGGRAILVLHDLATLAIDPAAAGIAVVVFGHSHRPIIETRESVVYLNPGSAGPRRFRLPITLATLAMDGDCLRPALHGIEA